MRLTKMLTKKKTNKNQRIKKIKCPISNKRHDRKERLAGVSKKHEKVKLLLFLIKR